jgi:hypothetical protein
MVWLTQFPLEVIEGIAPLLRDHHFARLYMSGDPRLQQLLSHIRSRKCRIIEDIERSALVVDFLIGTAAEVEAPMHLVGPNAFTSNPPRLTRLHIHCHRYDYIARKSRLDLSTFPSLEHFRTSGEYISIQTVALPPSITSVDLATIDSANPVEGFEYLPWLRVFKLRFVPSHYRRDFFESVRWPRSLVKLVVSMGKGANELRHYLPSTLTALTVICDQSRIDLGAFTDRQRQLTSLKIKDATSTIDSPLPPKLTSLNVNYLYITQGRTVVETFRHVPPSLTHFRCKVLDGHGRRGPVGLGTDDVYKAFWSLFPRLNLESVESLLGSHHSMVWSVDFKEKMRQLSIDHELHCNYFEVPVRKRGGRLGANHAATIMKFARTEEVAVRLINGRKRRREFSRNEESWHMTYRDYCIKMLELGIADSINLPVDLQALDSLSIAAIHQLVNLQIHPTFGERSLTHIVANNTLVCLETIEIIDESWFLNTLLNIHEHRRNLPRLERVIIPAEATPKVYGKLKRMFAKDMRLHFDCERHQFIYRASSPMSFYVNIRNSLLSRIPPREAIFRAIGFAMFAGIVILPGTLIRDNNTLLGLFSLCAALVLILAGCWWFNAR